MLLVLVLVVIGFVVVCLMLLFWVVVVMLVLLLVAVMVVAVVVLVMVWLLWSLLVPVLSCCYCYGCSCCRRASSIWQFGAIKHRRLGVVLDGADAGLPGGSAETGAHTPKNTLVRIVPGPVRFFSCVFPLFTTCA